MVWLCHDLAMPSAIRAWVSLSAMSALGCRDGVPFAIEWTLELARTGVVRNYDPVQLTHPTLREFAVMAAWLSVLAREGLEG